MTGILPSFHDGRLWKEGLGVEFASALFGNLGKSEKLCMCRYLNALFGTRADADLVKDARLSTVWANGGSQKASSSRHCHLLLNDLK